jgi:hypothetical protein
MKALLAIIIFADGAGALVGAFVTARMRSNDHWPAMAKVITVILGSYAAARFGIAWNTAEHGQEVIECVALQSPAYLSNYTRFATLQAAGVWFAVLILIASVMNGSLDKWKRKIASVFKKKSG